jgi:DNA-binding beta-propeller fold protein YncE
LQGHNSVGHYIAATGATINASLIGGLNEPQSLAVSDDGLNLFILTDGNSRVGEFNATTGAAVNAALLTGFATAPEGLASFGGNLYVSSPGVYPNHNGTIGEYTTLGSAINASLVTGLDGVFDIYVVPEPSTLALQTLGAIGLLARRRFSMPRKG